MKVNKDGMSTKMDSSRKRASYAPVSEHFRTPAGDRTRTRVKLNENGVFFLGMLAGAILVALIAIGWMMVTDSYVQPSCVAVSSVSEPVCGELVDGLNRR